MRIAVVVLCATITPHARTAAEALRTTARAMRHGIPVQTRGPGGERDGPSEAVPAAAYGAG
jgi:fructose-specific phosphotransferase system component IIB